MALDAAKSRLKKLRGKQSMLENQLVLLPDFEDVHNARVALNLRRLRRAEHRFKHLWGDWGQSHD